MNRGLGFWIYMAGLVPFVLLYGRMQRLAPSTTTFALGALAYFAGLVLVSRLVERWLLRRRASKAPVLEVDQSPVLEIAHLDVRPGEETAFEAAFGEAKSLIAGMPGFLSLKLQRCIETPNRYVLLVEWSSLEAHTLGFRTSPAYQEWKTRLHPFYDPFPLVEHYKAVWSA